MSAVTIIKREAWTALLGGWAALGHCLADNDVNLGYALRRDTSYAGGGFCSLIMNKARTSPLRFHQLQGWLRTPGDQ